LQKDVVYILVSVGTVVHCRNHLWVKIVFCWVLRLWCAKAGTPPRCMQPEHHL